MRRTFARSLSQEMQRNDDIVLLTADLGFGVFDELQKTTKNYYNVGASEQLMIGMAVGLAKAGKIPICYSITPFLLYRPFEFIRNYVNGECWNVKLVGSGRGKEYAHDGFSHWCEDEADVLSIFPNIIPFVPTTKDRVEPMMHEMLYNGKPSFLSLSRF